MDSSDPGVRVTVSGFESIETGAIIHEEELAIIEGCFPAIIQAMLRYCEQDAEG